MQQDLSSFTVFPADDGLFTAAFDAATNGLIIVDRQQPDDPIIYCNTGFEELTGYTRTEVLGRNCRFLQGPDTAQVTRKQLKEAINNGRECQVEMLNYQKDGTPFWTEIYISPVRDNSGKVTHYFGIQNNIDKRKSVGTVI